jgi:hypothetical protein
MPAKITEPRMFAWHRPPRIQPTSAVAKSKIRYVMPAEFITLPIRMNSGAASSGNEFAAIATFCGMMLPGMPATNRNANPARPIAA